MKLRPATIRRLLSPLGLFRRDERGSMAVEAMIMLIPLFTIFFAAWVYFTAFRLAMINDKASYAVADMLARQTNAVTPAFVGGMLNVYDFLLRGEGENPGLRVSLITYNGPQDRYEVVWSTRAGAGVSANMTTSALASERRRIPVLPNGERVLLVETFLDYEPPLNVGLAAQEFRTFTIMRPRFAPTIAFQGS